LALRFSGAGYVLPKQDTSGLPLTTINVDKVKLRLLRVNERNLVPSIDAERLTMSSSSYEVDEIIDSLVYAITELLIRPRSTLLDTVRRPSPRVIPLFARCASRP
jgi:hypothetical protein